jgi:hypothetical protein
VLLETTPKPDGSVFFFFRCPLTTQLSLVVFVFNRIRGRRIKERSLPNKFSSHNNDYAAATHCYRFLFLC